MYVQQRFYYILFWKTPKIVYQRYNMREFHNASHWWWNIKFWLYNIQPQQYTNIRMLLPYLLWMPPDTTYASLNISNLYSMNQFNNKNFAQPYFMLRYLQKLIKAYFREKWFYDICNINVFILHTFTGVLIYFIYNLHSF